MTKVIQFARYLIAFVAAAALVFCLGSLHLFASGLDQLTRDLRLDSAPEASLVYDRHNNLVFSFASEDRTNVPLDRVSPTMVTAVLTAEDRYFFRHAGMDVIGLARAAWVDLKARALKQGGSTITQQLIRHVALSTERTVQRKLKEGLIALRVERRFDKNKILEAYLNRIYFGNGHYGVEAAARGYFAKAAAELTAAESALLAGIIPCPSVCSPRTSAHVAKSRRDTVLRAMRESGALTEQEYADATASPVVLAAERHDPYTTTHHPNVAHGADAAGLHFLEAVRRQVMEQYGSEGVLKGGLRIYTTLDVTLQRHAEEKLPQGSRSWIKPTSSKGRSSHSIRARAKSSPWSEGATSTRARSIARCRQSGSPAPRSNRCSSLRHSSKVIRRARNSPASTRRFTRCRAHGFHPANTSAPATRCARR